MNTEEHALSALQEWQKQVEIHRQGREQSEEKSWARFSEWYDNWVDNNDYVELILPRLQQHVGSTARVLEIGPGSGAFTLALAPTVKEIVAVEPAPSMRTVLNRNLSKRNITNVKIVPSRIEEVLQEEIGHFDLTLASHSLYNTKSIDMVLRSVIRLSRHFIILMGTGESLKWRQALYQRFKGKDRIRPPQIGYFYPVLLEMGIYGDMEIFWTSANYVYNNEENLVEEWMKTLQLDETCRGELRSALLEIAERKGNQIGIYSRRRSVLVWIERNRSVLSREVELIPDCD